MIYKFFTLWVIAASLLFCCSSQKSFVNHEDPNSLDAQLHALSNQIVISLSQKQKSKIAIIEFSNLQGEVNRFGKFLAEELITRLYLTQKFEVIERQMLNKVMQEHQLNLSGLIDVNSAQKLGKILGVDAIASGSITDLGPAVKVNARLISTQTGKIFSVASATITKDDVVRKLMGETAIAGESPNLPAPMASSMDSPISVVEQNDFKFELKQCKIENRQIICEVIITNTSDLDKELGIKIKESKLFDEQGNEYPAAIVKIANSTSQKGWHYLNKLLVAGVPTPIEFIFENIKASTAKVTLMNLAFKGNIGIVKFRNILPE